MLSARQTFPAPPPFRLHLNPPKMVTVKEEIAITRAAVARDPAAQEYRYRLAFLLFTIDSFGEAIALLEQLSREGEDFRVVHLLAAALLARETPEDTEAAKGYSERAIAAAADESERSRALSLLGKALARLAETDAARTRLHQALDANAANKDAFKRLAMLDFLAERPQDALDLADSLIAKGVVHSRILGVRPLALARLGRIAEAREAFGVDGFLRESILEPPDGWETIDAFNRGLTAELMAHPGIRYERYGAASTHSWRIDEPALARSRLVPQLQRLIQRAADAYVAALPAGGHPWLRGRPADAYLHNWCVITDGDGFEEWHVHQNGWLSGAYYVDVPDFIVKGNGTEGCVSFGLPPGLVGEARHGEFGLRTFRPRAGLLMLFPSHAFHRTFAHKGDRRRICFAFDIAPERRAT